jgi:hypothetical protein
VGVEIFRTRPVRPWSPLRLPYSGYLVTLPGVKRPERDVNRPLPSTAEVEENVELYLYSPSVFVARYRVIFTFIFSSNHIV